MDKVLRFILLSLEEIGLDFQKEIDASQLAQTLDEDADDISQELLFHALGIFSESSPKIKLSENKIARFIGEQMLMTEVFILQWTHG